MKTENKKYNAHSTRYENQRKSQQNKMKRNEAKQIRNVLKNETKREKKWRKKLKNRRSLPAVTLALSGATINAKGQQQLQLQLRVALLAVGQHWPHSGRDLEKPVRKTFGLRRYQNGRLRVASAFYLFIFFLFLFYYDFLFLLLFFFSFLFFECLVLHAAFNWSDLRLASGVR